MVKVLEPTELMCQGRLQSRSLTRPKQHISDLSDRISDSTRKCVPFITGYEPRNSQAYYILREKAVGDPEIETVAKNWAGPTEYRPST